jgi:hypothetical protein
LSEAWSITQCGVHWPVKALMQRLVPGSQRS